MVPIRTRRFLAAILVLSLLAAPVATVAALEVPDPLSPAPGYQGSPRTDGETVVWSDTREDIPFVADVYGAFLPTGPEFPIAVGPDHQTQPDVDGSWVVWSDDGTIQAKNLTTDEQFGISDGPEDVMPAVSGDYVTWLRYDMDSVAVMSRNLATMADAVHIADLEGSVVDRPAISGNRVLWAHGIEDGDYTGWRLLIAQVDGTGQEIVQESLNSLLLGFALHGDLVVYVADGFLISHDLVTGEEQLLAEEATMATTNGRYAFWSDTRFLQDDESRLDLRGYDLYSNSRFSILQNKGYNALGNAGGDYLVWSHGPDLQGSNVSASLISDLLPTAPRPDPMATSSDWLYFSLTGHYLAYGFKDFWEQSGGLPVFGYPLTIEYDELNADLEEFRTAQYTERQRFEYHPENAGTPYETLLGRLGAEDAARRGLLDTEPFQPQPTGSSNDADCTFFTVTGQEVCGQFLDYWQSYGLEFGDPGISFRESLALFGYPISQEFADPDTGLTVQYFERARFEYHPDNPEPHRVLLGLLGVEELRERDWVE
jgi:hypothetical protein